MLVALTVLSVLLGMACSVFNADQGMPSPRVCGRHAVWMFGKDQHTHFDAYAKARWFEFTQGHEGDDDWHYRMTLQGHDDKLLFVYSHIGESNAMYRIHLDRTRTCRWDGEGFTFKKVGGR